MSVSDNILERLRVALLKYSPAQFGELIDVLLHESDREGHHEVVLFLQDLHSFCINFLPPEYALYLMKFVEKRKFYLQPPILDKNYQYGYLLKKINPNLLRGTA